MGRTILCPHCKTTFDEDILKKKNSMDVCLVCGESLLGENDNNVFETQKKKTTWYYYKGAGGIMTTTLYDDEEPLYKFEAINMKDAEKQLKEILPNSPLVNESSSDKVKCPRCRSTEVQLVPRKFSLLTGFATNKFDRMCVKCKKKF